MAGDHMVELLLQKEHRPSMPSVQARMWYALRVRWMKWVFLGIFALLVVGAVCLFIVDVIEHFGVDSSQIPQLWTFVFAHSFAQITKICTALILLPMLRNAVTWLRPTYIGRRIPTDLHVSFHKMMGRILFIAGIGHSLAWIMRVITLGYDNTIGGPNPLASGNQINSPFPEFITGLLCLVLLLVIVGTSLDGVKRRRFEVFVYTHWLWLAFMIAMFVHGENFWVWGIPSCVLWALDYSLRLKRKSVAVTDVECCVLPGGVMQIEFPKGDFDYSPGQYFFLNCPAISPNEWHPFTVSSSPTDPIVGDWTAALQRHFNPVKSLESSVSTRVQGDEVLRMDGPFGAPAQNYNKYHTVAFIGMGIGNTPFVSILRYLKYQIEAQMRGASSERFISVQHIYFFAICQDEESLLWFSDIMHSLTAFPAGFLRIYLFLTQFNNAEEAIGSVESEIGFPTFQSGMVPSINYGRPDFDKIMRKVSKKQGTAHGPVGDIGVFFCGPRAAGYTLENSCIKVTKETGIPCHFHKENF